MYVNICVYLINVIHISYICTRIILKICMCVLRTYALEDDRQEIRVPFLPETKARETGDAEGKRKEREVLLRS